MKRIGSMHGLGAALAFLLAVFASSYATAASITTFSMSGNVLWTTGHTGPGGLQVGDDVDLTLEFKGDTPTAGSFTFDANTIDATRARLYTGDGWVRDTVGGTLFFAPDEAVDQVSFHIRFNLWDGYDTAGDGSFVSALLALDAASDARGYGYAVEFIEAYCYWLLDKAKIRWDEFNVTQREERGSPVPLPGAVWLFGSGLAGLLAIRRRKRAVARG